MSVVGVCMRCGIERRMSGVGVGRVAGRVSGFGETGGVCEGKGGVWVCVCGGGCGCVGVGV